MSHFYTFYVSDVVITSAHFKVRLLVFYSFYLIRECVYICLYNMTCQYFSSSVYGEIF